MRLLLWTGLQSWVYRQYRKGVSTQPCGEPVLIVLLDERWGPGLTVWGRLVKMSFIQEHVRGGRPRVCSFIFVNVSKTWDDAQSYCRKYHTDLASVRNQFENEKLRKMMVDSFTWIGLYRNSWKWSDGSAYSFTSWAPSNPSLPVTASCGTIFGGKWFNIDCSQYWYFVCYTGEFLIISTVRSTSQ
uniref:C-type lectin domain-containing protein n=1 Tax=Amphilophus citrinellus TaxID=61819 RepID=A0A3Q0T7B0_AMPCI